MMSWKTILVSLGVTLAAGLGLPASAATTGFGSVVPIGGSASDIALDEARGALYIADLGAGIIDVMSTSDNAIHSSINVDKHPGAMAISKDSQFLLIAHYANGLTTPPAINEVTLIHLADRSRQTFITGDPPLGVAFLSNNLALIVTSTSILTFDPVSGQTGVVGTFANLSLTLPVPQATFPGQILETALATSGDGMTVWGIAGAGTGNQMIYRFDGRSGQIHASVYISSPALLPRVSVSNDGSYAMVGYSLISFNVLSPSFLKGRYPTVLSSTNITGHAIDSNKNIIYGQFPDSNQSTGPASFPSRPNGTAASANLPALLILDSDNLTLRDRITIPEDMVGRAVLNAAGTVLYAISESGVIVLPVGSLNQYHRAAATQEDILVSTNFCNRSAVTQSLTITDPGGGHTDFSVTPNHAGVTVSPSSGTTPATVKVIVDPGAFPGSSGTTQVTLQITSTGAVNQPRSVRLLLNNPDPSQRGTLIDQPGVLTDIMPDAPRNRFYVLRHDMNQLQVFDGSSNNLLTTLRTATSPTMMSFSADTNYLMVGHDDSQLVRVYDLNAMAEAPTSPIVLPGGHFARSIAQSNGATLILARNEGIPPVAPCVGGKGGIVDSVNLAAQTALPLCTLGIYQNAVLPTSVLTTSPNGSTVLLASPDGTVMLYSAAADTFVTSRQDLTSLSGAFAASNYNSYFVGNTIFNASLVPSGTMGPVSTVSSGFAFTGAGGYMASAASATGVGDIQQISDIQQMNSLQSGAVKPVSMSEAPLLPTAALVSTSSSSSSSGTGTSGTGSTGTGTGTGTSTGAGGSGSTSAYAATNFTRTVAPMPSSGTVVVLSTSGFTVLAGNYDAAVAPPSISSVVNAADGTHPVAPGGLITVYGQQMSPVNMATSQIPLPTALGDSCLSINGSPVPLLFVSSQQINAQLPYNVSGSSALTIHTPGGISDNFYFSVQSTAPSVFMSGAAGPQTGLAAIVRMDNNQLVTPTNPIHPKDTIVIFLTGMGQTTPQVQAGLPSPESPLALANVAPVVTLGGAALNVSYAGLSPDEVGVYQINATVPTGAPLGLTIPLTINQGGSATTINVRVVN